MNSTRDSRNVSQEAISTPAARSIPGQGFDKLPHDNLSCKIRNWFQTTAASFFEPGKSKTYCESEEPDKI